ncbi:serine recombinase [Robertmurraya siralis]|uniref:Serine recombinase n=1 Tax=Robertmurraya siralis TaxID=77777 RepID=A0A920BUM2_9BACI|nr:recombinase family protein [Robertmurraya siralis]GIN62736.1 serine recombinase [Robertmurraya siralis]
MDGYIYLRKSRKDLEEEKKQAELGNNYNTLDRHRSQLLELAKIKGVHIKGIYEEVVSGEYISERPEMQRMLREVDLGLVDAVLCMDLDRLGRGDMVDQGTIYRVFKNSETVILTPSEIIDPQDENQELTFSIKSLIAREELKTIVKRMQRGRHQSAKEGKSISRKPPYGYLRDENLKLSPDPDCSWVVEMIFKKAANGSGRRAIAEELDRLNIKPPESEHWEGSSIASIIRNEVYLGKIIWGKVKYTKINGKYKKTKMAPEHWHVKENAHEAIVSKELFDLANEKMRARWRPHVRDGKTLSNPLAGLLYCEVCGKAMVMQPRKDRPDSALRCFNHTCKGVQKGCNFSLVEQRILMSLEKHIEQFELPDTAKKKSDSLIKAKEKALSELIKEKEEINKQKNNIHDLLEKGVYDIETFLQRQQVIKEKLNNLENKIVEAEEEINLEKKRIQVNNEYIPRVKNVLEAYYSTDDIEKKNRLLKSVIEKASYLRKKEWSKPDEFEIILHTKI